MSEIKLLPCPFCGGEAKVKVSWRNEDTYVECRNCYSRTDGFGLEECAIEQWNTRKPIDRIVAELEEEKHIHTKMYRLSEYREYPEIKTRHEVIMHNLDKAIEIVRKGGVNDD